MQNVFISRKNSWECHGKLPAEIKYSHNIRKIKIIEDGLKRITEECSETSSSEITINKSHKYCTHYR